MRGVVSTKKAGQKESSFRQRRRIKCLILCKTNLGNRFLPRFSGEINDSHSATHIYDCAREEERLLMTVGRAGGKRGGVSMLGMPHFHFLSFSEKIFRHENSTLWFLKLSLEKKILLFPFQENTLIARLLLLIYPWYAWECKAQKSQFLSLLLHFSPSYTRPSKPWQKQQNRK